MQIRTHLFAAVGGYHGRAGQEGLVGIFVRRAERGVWEHAIPGIEGCSVFVHPKRPDTVFAGTAGGIYRSTDGGRIFEKTGFSHADKSVWCFMADYRDDDTIYAGTSPIMVYRSTDGGDTWTELSNATVPDPADNIPFKCRVMRLVQHPRKPDTIFAGLEVNGVIRTDDAGETWTNCSAELIAKAEQPRYKSSLLTGVDAEGMLDVHAITISADEPDRVILACRMGLFDSTDAGQHWSDMEISKFAPNTYARDLRIPATEPGVIYTAISVAAASHSGGVYRSVDAGRTWTRFDKVEVNGTVMSIALPPQDASCVYLGARYKGEVFGTEDGGETWHSVPLPAEVKDIYCLAAA